MEQTKRLRPTENGKEILRKVAKTLPKLSDYRKGYLLGYSEAMLDQEREGPDAGEQDEPAFAKEQ